MSLAEDPEASPPASGTAKRVPNVRTTSVLDRYFKELEEQDRFFGMALLPKGYSTVNLPSSPTFEHLSGLDASADAFPTGARQVSDYQVPQLERLL